MQQIHLHQARYFRWMRLLNTWVSGVVDGAETSIRNEQEAGSEAQRLPVKSKAE